MRERSLRMRCTAAEVAAAPQYTRRRGTGAR
jgi:hypothetical protein